MSKHQAKERWHRNSLYALEVMPGGVTYSYMEINVSDCLYYMKRAPYL